MTNPAIQASMDTTLASLDSENILNPARNRVDISFNNLIAYIERFETTIFNDTDDSRYADDPIKFLLKTYVAMAKQYYEQFKDSVLQEIADEANLHRQLEKIIDLLMPISTAGKADGIEVIEDARDASEEKIKELKRQYPIQLQRALDRLEEQWRQIYDLANTYRESNEYKDRRIQDVSKDVLQKDHSLIVMEILRKMVQYTAFSMGITNMEIVIVPGSAFSLSFFGYVENFAVLTVPIYSVMSPFEWSIFWHELAGYRVREIKSAAKLEDIKQKLRAFYQLCQTESAGTVANIFKFVARNIFPEKAPPNEPLALILSKRKNTFTPKHLKSLFAKKASDPQDEPYLKDFGNFEQIYEGLLDELLQNRQDYDNAKAQGWCVDWIEELFEDAWSVIAIREEFLEYFEDVLNRKNALGDRRHPPLVVRSNVAKQIIKLMNPNSKVESKPEKVEEIAAKRILEHISLLLAAAFMDEIYEYPALQSSSKDDRDSYLHNFFVGAEQYWGVAEVIAGQIGLSLQEWSNDTKGAGIKNEDKYLDILSSIYSGLAGTERKSKEGRKESFGKMLAGKNYRGLLELNFVEWDYLWSNEFTQVELNAGLKFFAAEAKLGRISVSVLFPDNTYHESSTNKEGHVRFTFNKKRYFCTATEWNDRFRPAGKTEYIIVAK
jgi:hypothetical protein